MVAGGVVMLLLTCLTWLFLKGVGIWGLDIPVGWGFAIINFVWWIGIGHAGTLISAILLLFKQTWRNSINRFAEAMTIFAVVCAGMFPLIHVGRPWLGYWLFPYPNTMNVWPQFRSPLLWDVFAVSTYATISVVFWYIGMIPDLAPCATAQRRPVAQYFYGMLALGWRGSMRHWMRYETASLLLAGLATPLVLSVHTVISFDFAVAHYAGLAHDDLPALLRRRRCLFRLRHGHHSGDSDPQVLPPGRPDHDPPPRQYGQGHAHDGLIVAYGYGMEVFMSWYSASHWEYFMIWNRLFGPMGWSYWVLITCNIALPQTSLWSRYVRINVGSVHHVLHREHGYVVRALRHRCDQPLSRLPAIVLGNL